MTSSLKTINRARPLLGTIVEIGVHGEEDRCFQEVISKAFQKIERIERLMSRFDGDSEVSKINRLNVGDELTVSSDLMRVLKISCEISTLSGGIFNISPQSVVDGDVLKLYGNERIKRVRNGLIDLGGIAKGYAVDQAIEYLKRTNVASAHVNAGGDVRAFGQPHEIFVRHPSEPNKSVASVSLHNNALATSANYDEEINADQSGIIVYPKTGQRATAGVSVSVMAPTCMVADALTKCMLMLKEKVDPLLHQFDARGFLVHGNQVTSLPKKINTLSSHAN